MLGALALGLLIMHSAAAIVTYFVLPTVVGIVVEVVSALHGPAEWFEPNRVTDAARRGHDPRQRLGALRRHRRDLGPGAAGGRAAAATPARAEVAATG